MTNHIKVPMQKKKIPSTLLYPSGQLNAKSVRKSNSYLGAINEVMLSVL